MGTERRAPRWWRTESGTTSTFAEVRSVGAMGLILLTVGGLTACGEGGGVSGSGWAGSVDTLESGVVHVRSPSEGLWADEQAWRLVEDLRLGSVDGRGPELFGSIGAFEVDQAGRIYVLDRDAFEVRVFGPDGTHLHSFGREGEGPGEFKRPWGLELDARGRVWVIDTGNQRYAVFDSTGTLVEEKRRFNTGNVAPWPGEVLADGRVIDVAFGFVDGEPQWTHTVHASDGTLLDTVSLPEYERASWVARSESGTTSTDVPFTPSLHRFIDASGAHWVGISDDYRVVETDLTRGDTVRVIERAYDPVPVRPAEKRAALAALDWFRRQGGDPEPSEIPDHHPPYQGFVVDALDHLWVRATVPREGEVTPENLYAPRPATFDVFDPVGRYLGRTRTPMPLRTPKVTDAHVYGVTVDELGVQYLVRMRIEGRR